MMKIFFAGWNIIRTFALAFESESCKQEKHCDKVPFIEFRQSSSRWTEQLCFRLSVYAVNMAYRSGVRYVP